MSIRKLIIVLLAVGSISLAERSANAHVGLLSPNGGEVMEVGSSFTVEWEILIAHGLQNWDLWYSTSSSNGPWTSIVQNLAAGSSRVGSLHSYDWTVPDAVDDSVWIRVRMDNSGTDYFDVNNDPFSIVAPPCEGDVDGSGAVDVTDLLGLLANWGSCKGCPEDLNDDNVVDVTDLLSLLANWGSCS